MRRSSCPWTLSSRSSYISPAFYISLSLAILPSCLVLSRLIHALVSLSIDYTSSITPTVNLTYSHSALFASLTSVAPHTRTHAPLSSPHPSIHRSYICPSMYMSHRRCRQRLSKHRSNRYRYTYTVTRQVSVVLTCIRSVCNALTLAIYHCTASFLVLRIHVRASLSLSITHFD